MSLIAHYPLNGNLRDYSGNFPNITGSWTIDDHGKIGKCYKKNGNLTLPISSKQIGTNSTLMFWIYTDSTSTGTDMLLGVDAPREFFTCFQYPTKNDFHWSSTYETNTTNYGGVDYGVLKDNEWTHVTLVYNDRTMYRYYNGELKGTTKYDNDLRYSSGRNLIVKGLTGTKLNDIRIYNHALSIKEIKEIVKCEVIHFNFNEWKESTTNICGFDGDFETFELGNNAGYTVQLGENNIVAVSNEITYSGSKSLKVKQTTGSTGRIFRTNPLGKGEVATFSAWVYSVKPGVVLRIELNGGGHAWTGFQSNMHTGKGWELLSVTTTAALGDTTEYNFIYPKDNNTIYVDNVQVEKKDHCSPFTNRTNLINFSDSSNYKNHSKEIPINSCPTWSNDSILGNGCYKFNGNSEFETISTFFQSTNVSISAWVKPTKRQSVNDRDMICGLRNPASCYLTLTPEGYVSCYNYSVNPAGYHNTTQVIPLNQWSHLVATWDSTKLRIYINGVKVKEVSHALVDTPVISTYLLVGGENTNRYYNGLIDDVKIFQSILSDEDVLKMYNTKISISDNNTLFSNEIIEYPNLFDVTTILNRQTALGINSSSKLMKYENVNVIALSAASFHSNSTYHSIFPENYFEPNTAYDFCITINSNLIYQGNEVPAGLRIRYSDNTFNDTFVIKTSGKWKQYYFRSDPVKTISKVEVYYYIGNLFYIDLSTSYIKKASNININNKGQIKCHEFIETNYNPGLLDYSTWSLTGAPGWSLNGPSSENSRIIYGNPMNDLDIMWYVPLNDAASDADGGFVSPKVQIDKTKKYRFSIWMRRENCGTGSGTSYFGLYAYNSSGTNTGVLKLNDSTVNTNLYFTSFPYTSYSGSTQDNWVLFVYYVHPNTYTATTSDPTSGAYKLDGTHITGGGDCKWNTDSTQASLRSYLYYSTKTDEKQYFYRPRIDLCDGSEPSISTLLKCSEHLPLVNPNGEYYPKNVFSMYNNKKVITNQFFEN